MLYDKAFQFRDTENFSPLFEYYEMEGMNFFMNAASIPILFVLGVVFVILMNLMHWCAKRNYTKYYWRKAGMYAA